MLFHLRRSSQTECGVLWVGMHFLIFICMYSSVLHPKTHMEPILHFNSPLTQESWPIENKSIVEFGTRILSYFLR